MSILPLSALDQLFNNARSMNGWTDTPVTNDQIVQIFDLMKMGATSANCCPARLVFVKSSEAKEKLAALAMDGNRQKILTASVTVIIGHDLDFASSLPYLFPHDATAPSWFSDPSVRDITAFRNGTLQGAYLMLAARAIGLDCGPMSGFDNEAVDEAFFAGTSVKSNFICGLGYGDHGSLFPRSPRFEFDMAAKIL